MTKGRKQLTNEQKILRGTNQPCRMTFPVELNQIETIPKVKLKGTAKKIFEYTASELIHKRLLEMVGLDLLVAYCREMAIYHDLTAEVEKEGYTLEVETKSGTMIQINPKRKIAESALTHAKSLASEFGFTPISKSRIAGLIEPKVNQDDFAQFEEID